MKKVLFSFLFLTIAQIVTAQTIQPQTAIDTTLFPFDTRTTDSTSAWLVLTDRVLQSNSRAEINLTDSTGVFTGEIANSQTALAQIISPQFNYNLNNCEKICLRVRGDSSTFILALHTDLLSSEGRNLETRFVATPEWQNLELSLSEFMPAYFDVPILANPPKLNDIHFLSFINAYQDGKFRLEIDTITLITK